MKPTVAAPPEVDLTFLLSWTSHALQTEMTAGLSDLGITPRAHCILHKAVSADLTQTQIADSLGLDKTTMVVLTDKLEKDGLAERVPSSTDRRARIIRATPAGLELLARSNKIVSAIQNDVLGTLPDELRGAFVDALTRLVEGRLATFAECEQPPRRRSSPI
ncbi:MarR family winged helix-turn-helix transcriptional regulator [Streptomyces griseorubiginosus]|uniref:MarR family winged helix-turn-helix transcriptional regulator n=1 Tax=Streptomyces griseorubiginosus TaxID=67304 RepID=UPI0033BA2D5A